MHEVDVLTTARSARRGEARMEGAPVMAMRARVVKCMTSECMCWLAGLILLPESRVRDVKSLLNVKES